MQMTTRLHEIRILLAKSAQEIIEEAGPHLTVCDDLEAFHHHFASDIFHEIKTAAQEGRALNLIVPVGPVGQYPILAELLNQNSVSLKNCTFFFMDEYCSREGKALGKNHPISFKKVAQDLFFARLSPEVEIPPHNILFPDEHNINQLDAEIHDRGGIDVCYGGIGIHGHVAFNEPEKGIASSTPRKVSLNDYTVTINAIRAGVGGDLENFPREAYTLGMAQILHSRKIRLYCRSGQGQDWAKTVLRLALFGSPGDDYPVTHIRGNNYHIVTDISTCQPPENRL